MSSETMQGSSSAVQPANTSLRLWPGLVVLSFLGLVRLWATTGEFYMEKFFFGLMLAPIASIGAVIIWWLFFSRLSWSDRLFTLASLIVITVATILIAGKNFPGMALIIYTLPILVTGWVGWLLLSIPFPWFLRRAGLVCVFLIIGTFCTLLRLDGMDGNFAADFHWRWEPTGEAKLLAELKSSQPTLAPSPKVAPAELESKLVLQASDWPGFRGPNRDGRLFGVQIETNWTSTPPKELWRHRIGPGWSSFAVVGRHVFTQEQRGDDELVVCYDAKTGEEIWMHRDETRFTEVVAGAGPRATPTFYDGRLVTLGANGTLNCLNASTGQLVWSKNIVADTDAKIPVWGFSSSPLVAEGIVSVFAGGEDSKSVVAYKFADGALAWTAGEGKLSYGSPHLAKLGGVEQVLMFAESGLTSFEPATGKVLWIHEWPIKDIARVVQPAILNECDILVGTGMQIGTRRISVTHADGAWTTRENWTSKDIRPYFNDLVVSDDALYGFDGPIFMCVDIRSGKRTWKTRGYGNGQVLLIADQKLLLILSETGEVALVEANPQEHRELAKISAITGKTWNHPVISNGTLFVRNAEEVAAFELKLQSNAEPQISGRTDASLEAPVDDK